MGNGSKRWVAVLVSAAFLGGCSLVGSRVSTPAAESVPIESAQEQRAASVGDGTLRYYYYLEAQAQEKKGDTDKAIAYLEKAIEQDPGSPFLKRELAVHLLKKNQTEKAKKIAISLLEKKPDDVEALILMGRIHMAQKAHEDAVAIYEKILGLDPGVENIYYFLGNYYLEKGDLKNATRIYSRLVEQFPGAYVGYFYLGRIALQQKAYRDAEEYLLRTLELAPELEAPRRELLELYEITGDDTKSIALYQEMWDRDPENVKIAASLALLYHRMGREGDRDTVLADMAERLSSGESVISLIVNDYLEKERYEEALILVDGMLKADPANDVLSYLGGLAYEKVDDLPTAISYLKKVPRDSRLYRNAVVHIAFLYQQQDRVDEAVAYLQERLAVSPEVPDFWLFYGTLLEERGEIDAAVEAVNRGLSKDPGHAGLHFRLGTLLDKKGDKEGSIRQMRKVLELEPENANALNYLGYTFADMNIHLDEAETLVKKALELKPDDGYIIDSLAWVYFKKGRYEEALEQLEKAIRLVPDDPVILEHLGDVHLRLGNREEALSSYQRSLEMQKDPDSEDARKVKEKIRQMAP